VNGWMLLHDFGLTLLECWEVLFSAAKLKTDFILNLVVDDIATLCTVDLCYEFNDYI